MEYNAIDMTFGYRASSSEIVISLVEEDWFMPNKDDFFPYKETRLFGFR